MDYTKKLTTRFNILRSLCYNEPSSGVFSDVDTIKGSTHARTNGYRLTAVNKEYYKQVDSETECASLLHEVTHYQDGSESKRGDCSHGPVFWEEYARNINRIIENSKCRSVVKTIFCNNMNWNRLKYRSVQKVSQVDGRIESVDERQEKLAAAIGYENIQFFEHRDWSFARPHYMQGRNDVLATMDKNAVEFCRDERHEDNFLKDFIRKENGIVPLPLIILPERNEDEYNRRGPQQVGDDENWWLADTFGQWSGEISLELQDRVGRQQITAIAVRCLQDVENLDYYSDIIPYEFDGNKEYIWNRINDVCERYS